MRFFLRANPLWRDGQSLLVVIPLGLWESLAHLGLFLQALRPTAAR